MSLEDNVINKGTEQEGGAATKRDPFTSGRVVAPQKVIFVAPGKSIYSGNTNLPVGGIGATFSSANTEELENDVAISDVSTFFVDIDMGVDLEDGGPVALGGEQPKAGDLNIHIPATMGSNEYHQVLHFNQSE